MNYTIDQLFDIIKDPVDSRRWGSDTSKILAIIQSIKTANCSTCMLRRKIIELNSILGAYGDSVGMQPGYTVRRPNNNAVKMPSYIACPDCVAKHLATSFVLQGEFYQGYTERLPLIESNLNEALLECPPDNVLLRRLIQDAIRSVVIDKEPKIPIVLMDQLNGRDTTKTSVSIDNPKVMSTEDITKVLSRLNTKDIELLKKISYSIPEYKSYDDILDRVEWAGRLNLMSDIIAPYSPALSRVIRDRRLRCYDNPSDETIDPVWLSCCDIVDAIRRYE